MFDVANVPTAKITALLQACYDKSIEDDKQRELDQRTCSSCKTSLQATGYTHLTIRRQQDRINTLESAKRNLENEVLRLKRLGADHASTTERTSAH